MFSSLKTTFPQLVKKLPAFYEVRRFTTIFTVALSLFRILNRMNTAHTHPLYFYKTH
jgi:hypothetical protein